MVNYLANLWSSAQRALESAIKLYSVRIGECAKTLFFTFYIDAISFEFLWI